MAGSASTQEQIIAFSKTAQTDIVTPSTDVIRINTISADPAATNPVVEDDADEVGKGHEFPEESFLTSWDVSKKLNIYASAEGLAACGAYGLGNRTATSTYKPIDPVTDPNGIELPWMTFYEAVRPGGAAEVYSRAFLGMVVDKWTLKVESGPGRKNSTLDIELMGTGKYVDDSGLVFPAKTPVHLLPSASVGVAINGVDYVTTKNFVSLEFVWDNALRKDSGYFPGSGFQVAGDATSGAVRGRMEFGKRSLSLKFVARYVAGSPEFASLKAQTAGTAVVTLSGGTGFDCSITCNQTRISAAQPANDNGILTLQCSVSAQVPAGGNAADLLTIVAPTGLGTLGR